MSSNDRSGCDPLSSRSTRPGLGVRSSSERAPPTSADARTRRSRRLVAPPTSSARCRPTRMHSTAGRAQIEARPGGKAERRPVDLAGRSNRTRRGRGAARPGARSRCAMAARLTASGGRPAVNVAHGPSASIPRATSRAGSSRSTASPAMRERQRAPGGHFSGPGDVDRHGDDAAPGAARLAPSPPGGRPSLRAVAVAASPTPRRFHFARSPLRKIARFASHRGSEDSHHTWPRSAASCTLPAIPSPVSRRR